MSNPGTWVAVDACSLPTAEQPLRVAEFDGLFAAALLRIERRDQTWLRLHLAGGSRETVEELVDRESRCCTFFAFTLTPTAGHLELDIRVLDGRAAVLDGIAARAAAA